MADSNTRSKYSEYDVRKTDYKIPQLTFLLILCSFIITIIFLIVATYSTSIYDLWYAAAAYISIILITACYVLFVFKCRNKIYA